MLTLLLLIAHRSPELTERHLEQQSQGDGLSKWSLRVNVGGDGGEDGEGKGEKFGAMMRRKIAGWELQGWSGRLSRCRTRLFAFHRVLSATFH